MSSAFALCCFFLLNTGAEGFGILPGKSMNHLEITKMAILNATVQTCRSLAQSEGTNFKLPAQPFTVDGVATACNAAHCTKPFQRVVLFIQLWNTRVDLRHPFDASFHFDSESFVGGKEIILEGMEAVKASAKQGNYEAARQMLGEILHPLQDFYSHSNWVELGSELPNPNLIKADTSIGNLADKSRATCRSCDRDDCKNNILEDIIAEKVITSGYFDVIPFFSSKPKGKCSHGGFLDQTSKIEPVGGINKDTLTSSHGHLHIAAANMAVAASSQLLDDIRSATGDKAFLEMLGISKGSSRGLCLVVDTSSSMSDDMETVKNVTTTIIHNHVGTEEEPSTYILIPFSKPGRGSVMKTSNSGVFLEIMNSLTTSGKGDNRERSLSGLKLALITAPPNSEIFLFTDAPAKDAHLKGAVIALVERKRTVVNFLITNYVVTTQPKQFLYWRIGASDAQLYKDIAQASGGQAIEVSKNELLTAASIITKSVSDYLVTLLQAARDPGRDDRFTFLVDETVTNLRVYITGSCVSFTLTSPTGTSLHNTNLVGSFVTTSQSVGNFRILELQKHVGQWQINMSSHNPYSVKVIGESPIDFLFYFAVLFDGPYGGFDVLDTRPRAGQRGSLLVTLTGSNNASLTDAALVGSQELEEISGVVQSQSDGTFLVQFDRMPSVEFSVRVKGKLSSNVFQRQSPTNFRASNLTITADSHHILDPGTPLSIPFSVTNGGAEGNLTIRVTNSRNFSFNYPSALFVESGNSANGTVMLSAPLNTPSGTDVLLTIEAVAPGATDTNYIVLRLIVVNPVKEMQNK